VSITEAEWKAMKVVWEHYPASARDVHEVLEEETGWAYSTVRTILNRLVEKGVLAVRRRANTNLYHPLVSRRGALRRELQSVLNRAFDSSTEALMRLLLDESELSEADRDALRERINRNHDPSSAR